MGPRANDELFEEVDRLNAQVCMLQRKILALIARAEDPEDPEEWEDEGARDLAHLLSIRYGISWWKADRWVRAGRALQGLPATSEAFERGEIGIDKVVELCRFATPSTEARLLRWAEDVSASAIRRRADLEVRRSKEEAEQAERWREVQIRYTDEGAVGELLARLPAAEMAMVEQRMEQMAYGLPVMPEEDQPHFGPQRLADALVAICQGVVEATPATIVVHAPVEALGEEGRSARVGTEGVVVSATLARLLCDSRLQVVADDPSGNPIALGRSKREPSASMLRLLRHRDPECRFPGCGTRHYLKAHHIRWWSRGGPTDVDNLVMICTFHHKLVHEYGWSVVRDPDNTVHWYRADGTRYRAGPSRAVQASEPMLDLSAFRSVTVAHPSAITAGLGGRRAHPFLCTESPSRWSSRASRRRARTGGFRV